MSNQTNWWRAILLGLCFALACSVSAKTCVDTACVQISSRLASVSSERGVLLNALSSTLLDSPVNVTSGDWQTLAQTPLNLQKFVERLQARTGAATPDAALDASVSLVTVIDAARDALIEQGQTAAANALAPLRDAASRLTGTFRLSDMLDACADCGALENMSLSTLDFASGSISLYNYKNGPSTPTPVTISGSSLGLGDTVNSIEFYASATEPPRIVCGPAGTKFYSSANRYKFAVDLVDKNLTGALNTQLAALGIALPVGATDVQVQLGRLEFYAATARAEGTIQSVNALAQAVTVQAKPGVADLYLGRIADNVFFDKPRTLQPATDLQFGEIGTFTANLAGTPVTAAIRAKSSAQGQSPTSTTLNFNGPFPQTQTASSGAGFTDNLVQSLVNNLELEVVATSPSPMDAATQTAFDSLVTALQPGLKTVFQQALSPVLSTLVTQAVNPVLELNGVRLGEADVTVLSVSQECTFDVSGRVYLDANRNATRDEAEAGTALTLYAKLVPGGTPGGPATQAVAVNPGSGTFAFSGVEAGTNVIVLDDNATLTDVTPTIPAGWVGTESPSLKRTVVTAHLDLLNQNFGLVNATTLKGTVFKDNGAGSGTANDGVKNGAETGLAGVTVKLTDATGATVHDTATTDGSGNYTLFIPASVAAGASLKVVEANPASHVSTGTSIGDTGGAYDRASDAVTFTRAVGTSYSGVNFGDVPESRLLTDGQQAGLPGSAVFYAHQFVAGTAGQVTFTTASVASPANGGWSHVLYRDVNGNGKIDAGEPVVSGPVSVVADENVSLIVKEFIPADAPFNAQDQVKLTASFAFANASPVLTATLTRTDLTTVGSPTTAGLTLVKTVDKASAAPGEFITYTLAYANQSSEPLASIVISDTTPAFTTLVVASNGPLPQSLTAVSVTTPASGASGPLRWTFTGTLAPGSSGTVSFQVRLQ